MSPTRSAAGRGKSSVEEAEASAPVVLGVSRFRIKEAITKVRGLVADAFNEGGTTDVRVGSDTSQQCSGALQPVFTHALMAGLVPPFSAFLFEILQHYQIHLLHLHRTSITILATFAYQCEAFLGVEPSVAFLHRSEERRVGKECLL